MTIVEHIVKKNTPIYKGFHSSHIKNLKNINDKLGPEKKGYFFTDVKEDAEKYGIVFVFLTTRDLRLIDMPKSREVLLQNPDTPKNVKDAITKYFNAICKHREKSGYRNSISAETDRIVGDHCCYLGYDGYYTGKGQLKVLPMNRIDEPSCAEAEMYICDPIEEPKIMFIEQLENTKLPSPPKTQPKSKKRKLSPSLSPNRSRLQHPPLPLPPPQNLNFQFTPPNTPPPPPPPPNRGNKLNFNGGYVIRPSKISQKNNISKKSKMVRSKTKSRKSQRKTSRKSQKTSSSYLP